MGIDRQQMSIKVRTLRDKGILRGITTEYQIVSVRKLNTILLHINTIKTYIHGNEN